MNLESLSEREETGLKHPGCLSTRHLGSAAQIYRKIMLYERIYI